MAVTLDKNIASLQAIRRLRNSADSYTIPLMDGSLQYGTAAISKDYAGAELRKILNHEEGIAKHGTRGESESLVAQAVSDALRALGRLTGAPGDQSESEVAAQAAKLTHSGILKDERCALDGQANQSTEFALGLLSS